VTGSAELHNGEYAQVVSKELPAGSWVISARATVGVDRQSFEPAITAFNCELRNDNSVIGVAQDWGSTQAQLVSHTLPLNGIITLSESGTISMWCRAGVSDSGFSSGGASSEMTIIQVGNVF
jgi:hypothetical protein